MSYSTGTVYKIICRTNSDIVYIGSTFNSLRNRWQCHKEDFRKYLEGKARKGIAIYPYFEKYGIENFKIIRVKEYECYRTNRADYKHLQAYEQLWINKTKGCVNKVNPFCIRKLTKKQYYENNKENVREYKKQYQIDNREKLIKKDKERYEKNKDDILKQMKQYRTDNKEKIRVRKAKEYQKNKEKIREQQNKPKFCKICHCNVMNVNFKRHTRTEKHIRYAAYTIKEFIVSKYRK